MAKPRSERKDAEHGAAHAQGGDDASMFRAAVRDVKPLTHTPRASGSHTSRKRRRPALSAAEETADSMPLLPEGAAADAITGADALSFRRPGVRHQVLRHLRRGLFPIEDELDLHGLGQAAARDRLGGFIEGSRNAGLRCVRVVHGKGYRSGARGPILKVAVDSWLRRHGDVMAFTSARSIDGGTGAVYVLLRA